MPPRLTSAARLSLISRPGLEANEFCMWVTSEPLSAAEAQAALAGAIPQLRQYLADGQIEILDYSKWYTPGGKFDADRVLQGWSAKTGGGL